MSFFTEQPAKPLGKPWLIALIGLSLVGIWVTVCGFFVVLPTYQSFRDDVAGSDLAQNPDAVQTVWGFFFVLLMLPALALGCAGFALYCIRLWRRG